MENKTIIAHAHDVAGVIADEVKSLVSQIEYLRESSADQGKLYFKAVKEQDRWGIDYREKNIKENLVKERLLALQLDWLLSLSPKDVMKKDAILELTISAPEEEEQD